MRIQKEMRQKIRIFKLGIINFENFYYFNIVMTRYSINYVYNSLSLFKHFGLNSFTIIINMFAIFPPNVWFGIFPSPKNPLGKHGISPYLNIKSLLALSRVFNDGGFSQLIY